MCKKKKNIGNYLKKMTPPQKNFFFKNYDSLQMYHLSFIVPNKNANRRKFHFFNKENQLISFVHK